MQTELNSVLKINLHNHTTMSDGTLIIPALIGVGIEEFSLDVIGVSDHFMTEKVGSCVDFENISEYTELIRERGRFYRPSGKYVLAGLELDLTSRFMLCDFDRLSELNSLDIDYLLYENVFEPEGIEKVIRASQMLPGKLNGFAHWDLRENFSIEQFCDFIPGLTGNDIFIEVTSGAKSLVRHASEKKNYPYFEHNIAYYRAFVEAGGMISIGTDTHFRIDDIGEYKSAYSFFWENGLEQGVIRFIEFISDRLLEGKYEI